MKIPAIRLAAMLFSLLLSHTPAQTTQDGPLIVTARGLGGWPLYNGAAMEMGTVDAYQTSVTSSVMVKNVGQAPLNCQFRLLGPKAHEFELGMTESVIPPYSSSGSGSQQIHSGLILLSVKYTAPAPRVPGNFSQATLRITTDDPGQPVYDVILKARVIAPYLAIERQVGQPLILPTALDLGDAQVGSTRDITLTVRNTGQTGLSGLSHLISQADTTGKTYTVIKRLPAVIPPGATGEITLRYAAQDIKEEPGTLTLIVGSLRRQYTVNLAGVGVGSRVGFESPLTEVFQGHSQVVVRLTRSPVGASAAVKLITEASPALARGAYEAALPGRDYVPSPRGTASTVYFAANESFKDVAVTLLAPESSFDKNQQFTLRLVDPGLATVVDRQRPTTQVRITSPNWKRLNLSLLQGRGTLALAAVPATGATSLFPAGADAFPKTAMVRPGTRVTLTAKPAPNQIFNSWSFPSGLQVVSQIGETLSFIVPGSDGAIDLDLDVSVGASFIDSPFIVPEGRTQGVHALLKQDVPGGLAPMRWQGALNGALTPSGVFTAKLVTSSTSTPVIATFLGSGPALFTIAGQKRDSMPIMNSGGLSLRLENNDDPARPFRAIVFQSEGGNTVFTSVARRASYSPQNNVPPELLNSSAKGYYTLLGTQSHWQPDSVPANLIPPYPKGHGFASIILTPAGQITLTGLLADSTSVTLSASLVDGDLAPVFLPLALPDRASRALVTGHLAFTFSIGSLTETQVQGDLAWYRESLTNSGPKVPPLYRQGWPDGILMALAGAFYDPALSVQAALQLDPPLAGQGNARLTFTGAALLGQLQEITNFSVVRNFISKYPAYDPSFTFSFNPATGFFSGKFTPAWADGPNLPARPAYQGIILQKQHLGAGFYTSGVHTGVADQESSPVILSKPSVPQN